MNTGPEASSLQKLPYEPEELIQLFTSLSVPWAFLIPQDSPEFLGLREELA